MVRVKNPGPESPGGIGNHLRRHRVGEIHGQKGNINIFEALHFRGVFRVSGNIDALAAAGNDVAVTDAFGRGRERRDCAYSQGCRRAPLQSGSPELFFYRRFSERCRL